MSMNGNATYVFNDTCDFEHEGKFCHELFNRINAEDSHFIFVGDPKKIFNNGVDFFSYGKKLVFISYGEDSYNDISSSVRRFNRLSLKCVFVMIDRDGMRVVSNGKICKDDILNNAMEYSPARFASIYSRYALGSNNITFVNFNENDIGEDIDNGMCVSRMNFRMSGYDSGMNRYFSEVPNNSFVVEEFKGWGDICGWNGREGLACVVNSDTPELIDALIRSIRKNSRSIKKVIVFENSLFKPFDKRKRNYGIDVEILDNSRNDLVDFSITQQKIEEGCTVSGWVIHSESIDWLVRNIGRDFILLDSDVLVKNDLSWLVCDKVACVGTHNRNRARCISRVLPYCTYINAPLIMKNGINFFSSEETANVDERNLTDTGSHLLMKLYKKDLPIGFADTSRFIEHCGSGSWRGANKINDFLKKNKKLFLMKGENLDLGVDKNHVLTSTRQKSPRDIFINVIRSDCITDILSVLRNSFVVSCNKKRLETFSRRFDEEFGFVPRMYPAFVGFSTQMRKVQTTYSHISIVRMAYALGMPFVGIFEDDAAPLIGMKDRFSISMRSLPKDAGCAILGNLKILGEDPDGEVARFSYDWNILKGSRISGGHAYIIFESAYQDYLNLSDKAMRQCDQLYGYASPAYLSRINFFTQINFKGDKPLHKFRPPIIGYRE